MPIIELFSKRQKKLRGDVPDVFTYDNLPNDLRVQVVQTWEDSLGSNSQYYSHPKVQNHYKLIVDILCREYGLFKLPTAEKFGTRRYNIELANYFLDEDNIERVLDVVELCFRVINNSTRTYEYLGRRNSSVIANRSIEELNQRLKEHGVGYQFVDGDIIRIDSELIHSEVIKPALRLLNGKKYEGAQQEFLSGYDHYLHGKNEEALNECLKAFESTMKVICDKKKWDYSKNATAKNLIEVCLSKGLIPAFWESSIGSLRSLLESGIPTGRNKLSGHGKGTEERVVPGYLVSYMLHMTGATIVFLINSENEL